MIEGAIARAQNEPRAEYYLAVMLADDQLIGFARLGFAGVKAAKLGYAIAANHWDTVTPRMPPQPLSTSASQPSDCTASPRPSARTMHHPSR